MEDKKVLEEEEYLSEMASIIKRDFFPDLLQSSSKNMTLNEFVNNFTSQDNNDFKEILKLENIKNKEKYKHFYIESNNHDVLTTKDTGKTIENTAGSSMENGNNIGFRVKSNLMYGPEGHSHITHKIETKPQNTRFKVPLPLTHKKIEKQGYSMVPSTPTIEPHKDIEPIITWGEIGTPLGFHIPDTPHKDIVAHKLEAKKRTKSPAIALLQKKMRGNVDNSLRQSYSPITGGSITPSLRHVSSGSQTPNQRTPAGIQRHSSVRNGSLTPKTDAKVSKKTKSITDDLLNI